MRVALLKKIASSHLLQSWLLSSIYIYIYIYVDVMVFTTIL